MVQRRCENISDKCKRGNALFKRNAYQRKHSGFPPLFIIDPSKYSRIFRAKYSLIIFDILCSSFYISESISKSLLQHITSLQKYKFVNPYNFLLSFQFFIQTTFRIQINIDSTLDNIISKLISKISFQEMESVIKNRHLSTKIKFHAPRK